MQKSLFAQYFEERENKVVLENEHGFVMVVIAKIFWIEHIFVKKESRGNDHAHFFEQWCIQLAKEKGFSEVFGSVSIRTQGSEFSLKMMLDHGYKLHSISGDLIFLKKAVE